MITMITVVMGQQGTNMRYGAGGGKGRIEKAKKRRGLDVLADYIPDFLGGKAVKETRKRQKKKGN